MLEIGNSGFRADGEQEGKTASSHQTDCSNEKQTSTIYYEIFVRYTAPRY
ncbi:MULTISPECIES: hypothetical protein [Paenibacillus]|nr:hypothetical protein [Paenibacillus sp. JMULE4]